MQACYEPCDCDAEDWLGGPSSFKAGKVVSQLLSARAPEPNQLLSEEQEVALDIRLLQLPEVLYRGCERGTTSDK